MSFTFRPAVREQTSLMIGLAGPSSSGKTYSALRLAKGLANGGPIAVIDTESRRALHYADAFDFQYAELTAPFRPERYMQALEAAKKAGASVIIVDSMSHEHEGPGGILEWHEEELNRMAGDDFRKRERVKFTAWIKPKQQHNRFVNSVLQLGIHVIFCFRAKPKLEMVKNAQGKTEPVDAGWQPICSDRFEYEMTALLMLPPNGHGIPSLEAPATKLQEQHKPFIQPGQQISEETGRLFGKWASGGAAPAPREQPATTAELSAFDAAKAIAAEGVEAFRDYWGGLTKAGRAKINAHRDELRQIAEAADAEDIPDDPFAISDSSPSNEEPDLNREQADQATSEQQEDLSNENGYCAAFKSWVSSCETAAEVNEIFDSEAENRDKLSEQGKARCLSAKELKLHELREAAAAA